MQALRALCFLGLSCVCLVSGCGDDDKKPTAPSGGHRDSGPPEDGGGGSGGGGGGKGGAGGHGGTGASDSGLKDSGPDAMTVDPNFDASGDYKDGSLADDTPGTDPPDDWSCLEELWTDGVCDCGCSARDFDCTMSSCSDPGCKEDSCGACFDTDGLWMSCLEPPDASDWTCPAGQMTDGLCDCGCGIPDPACGIAGCTLDGCRATGCQVRNCTADVAPDEPVDNYCNNNPTLVTWNCAPEAYGGADGCDCGCGMFDPDCGGGGEGCKEGRCFDDACTTCHDQEGRSYACAAAEAGWDQDTTDGSPGSLDVSHCNAVRFDAADGCDCGCGGIDPDCGDEGCSEFGCSDSQCDRCTDGFGEVIGCADPTAAGFWDTNACDLANFGTDDGCDCGCGAPDPDCDGDGSVTTAYTDDCDVCHDGGGGYDACPDWDSDCGDALIANGSCDCGCGVVDPDCRLLERASCTEPGCELTTCQYCNEDAARTACGGDWASDLVESACAVATFDLDGLCDCGCGVADPDCGDDEGCTEKGCSAPGCAVCHNGYLLSQCQDWYCDEDRFGDGDCDCGCGAPDPDCEEAGCTTVGCEDDACEVCHDPLGRVSPCPPGD
jgi:hypothetical protein